VRVYLFVCMHNHVHLLCETPKANLSAFMHKLQTAYTVYHNFEEAVLRRRCYGCKARAVAALLLGRHAGMNRRDVGVFLGMGTGSAVCRQLRDLWERMTSDRSPGEIVSRAESAMQQTASQSHEP
jgi:REP element-mobilizing transposase RayT